MKDIFFIKIFTIYESSGGLESILDIREAFRRLSYVQLCFCNVSDYKKSSRNFLIEWKCPLDIFTISGQIKLIK